MLLRVLRDKPEIFAVYSDLVQIDLQLAAALSSFQEETYFLPLVEEGEIALHFCQRQSQAQKLFD